ncbi:MAG TPA: hypothetical protein VE377_21650 [Candidatus Dormibacteraeota bacterium]|nr:hypothetical protein [Candidatus Dormibacteraeota bacterium]
MSRTKILILTGSGAITLGVLLLGWVNDSARPLYVAAAAGLLLLVPGILIVLAGCLMFCCKEEPNKVMLAGLMISGVSLIVIPGSSLLLHFEPNVHDWTGLLFFMWLPSCAVGPVFVLVGLSRRFLQNRKG